MKGITLKICRLCVYVVMISVLCKCFYEVWIQYLQIVRMMLEQNLNIKI